MQNGIGLRHVDEALLPTAVTKVTAQLESEILPQLRCLRRNFMGSPNPELLVIPPRWLWAWKEKRVWPSMIKEADEYVLCHTDLDRQNILVDPSTFKIVSIIDWETAGFSPQNGSFLTGRRMDRGRGIRCRRRPSAGKSQHSIFQFPPPTIHYVPQIFKMGFRITVMASVHAPHTLMEIVKGFR